MTAYDIAHGKQLHLIVVRRDLASFQHVHPVLDARTGVWTTTLETSQAGIYRVFADTVPTGHDGLTLGADLAVAGDFTPAPVATGNARTAEVDGYRVELTGQLRVGRPAPLTATVSRVDRPVTDRPLPGGVRPPRRAAPVGLAYLHVHPDGHLPGRRHHPGRARPSTSLSTYRRPGSSGCRRLQPRRGGPDRPVRRIHGGRAGSETTDHPSTGSPFFDRRFAIEHRHEPSAAWRARPARIEKKLNKVDGVASRPWRTSRPRRRR